MQDGDKSAYANEQNRQIQHVEEGYERRSVPKPESIRRTWTTENKTGGGGKNRSRAQPGKIGAPGVIDASMPAA